MVAESLILASEAIGFISFAFTLLTWLGVYADLIKTIRGAPTLIPIALGNLREEIRYEQLLCKQQQSAPDQFHILPRSSRPGKRSRQEINRLLSYTLRHMWTTFIEIERRFLLPDQHPPDNDNNDHHHHHSDDSADEKHRRSNGGGGRPPKPTKQQSYIRSRMGWIEAGLSHDQSRYYNTDFPHRLLWWWKKDDINNLALQIQRLQIRRVERDTYETNELVKRALRLYARRSRDDVYTQVSEGSSSGSEDGGGPRGGHGRGHHRRRSAVSHSRTNGRQQRRRSRNGSIAHGGVREVPEKEVVRRRGSRSPVEVSSASPRRATSVAGSRRGRPQRGSVVYEYEIVDPGGIHVEYGDSRRNERWQEGRQRSYSRGRRQDEGQ